MVDKTDGEILKLVCRKCGKQWEKIKPEGYLVRYNHSGVFLVNRKDTDKKKTFRCPDCKTTKHIGRLAVQKIKMNAPRKPGGPA